MRCTWLLAIICSSFLVEAQPNNQYLFRHIDQRDGLLHNTVYSITQDKKGFMWIGTSNGVQRYDGLRFSDYASQMAGFSYNGPIKDIFVSDSNFVWVITD